jgi:hypothetical protein
MRITFWLTAIACNLAMFGPASIFAQWSPNGDHIYNTNNGNVGIGINSPGYLLHTAKNMTSPTICIQNLGGGGGAQFEMIDNLSGADWKFKATTFGGFKIRDHTNGIDVLVVEQNSAANSIYITQGGNIGIGTANPLGKLSVIGDINATDSIMVANGKLITGDFKGASLNGVINCGGASRNYTNVMSDILDPAISFAVGDEDLYIQDVLEVGTNAFKPGGGSWSTLSDERCKKNIEPFTDGLSRLMEIRPVSYQYNENAFVINQEKRYVGILAQDMLAIAPYMVEEKFIGQRVMEIENGVDMIIEEGTLAYTFDPSALNYLIINAVQEQQHMLESQQQRIVSLERDNEALKLELKKILAQIESYQE